MEHKQTNKVLQTDTDDDHSKNYLASSRILEQWDIDKSTFSFIFHVYRWSSNI